MIILRHREFGRTGLTKDQAKKWFKGGNGKLNKALKQMDELKTGADKLSRYADEKTSLLRATYDKKENKLSNLYAKYNGELPSRKSKQSPNVIALGRKFRQNPKGDSKAIDRAINKQAFDNKHYTSDNKYKLSNLYDNARLFKSEKMGLI